MARACPRCGRANDDDASFCQGCGAAITAAGPGPGKHAPRWLIALIAVSVIALAGILTLVFYPSGEPSSGETSQTASTGGASVAISPKPALEPYLAGAVGPRADRLATISADGTVQPITRFGGDQIWQIAYSPDGKWLACIAGTFKRSELWLFDAATGAARQATASTPNVVAVDSIAWLSPKGLLVAAHTETPKATGQNAQFLVYDTAAKRFAPLHDAGGVALRGVSVSASRDGSRVAFVTYTDHKTDPYGAVNAMERLEVLDRGSGQVTELGTNKAVFEVNARAFDEPLISPGGQAIIYRRAGSDVGTSYTVISIGGTTLMPEKQALMPAGYAWDPGGTKVVFTGQSIKSATGSGPVIFWQFDTQAGGAPQEIARYRNTVVQDLSWSPDGTTIAWAAFDRKKEWRTGTVYLMPATGGEAAAFAEEALSPVWAPVAAEGLQTSPSP